MGFNVKVACKPLEFDVTPKHHRSPPTGKVILSARKDILSKDGGLQF